MGLPGFDAEVSVSARGKYYWMRSEAPQMTGHFLVPAQVFRGCYYGPTSYYDCDIAGFRGVMNSWWSWYICDNRYCPGGFGLVTSQ
jgi:hypothetical protein